MRTPRARKQASPASTHVGIAAQPVAVIEWVERERLFANDYNPNKVAPAELRLLKLSIMEDGWTQPIVALDSGEIVDGFHRWGVSGDPDILVMTDGKVPVVYLRNLDRAQQMMATIRHNRARGQHLIMPMADIVRDLKDTHHVSDADIERRLQMEDEEVDRLYDRAGMPTRAGQPQFNPGWKPGDD